MKMAADDVLEDFLDALFPIEAEGLLEFRALPRGTRIFVVPGDYRTVRRFIRKHQDQNIFVGIATRTKDGDGSLANCHDLWAVWVDIDFSKLPESEARQRLQDFAAHPSIVISTGHGLHAYWRLTFLLDVREHSDQAYTLLRRLARHLGGDPASAEPARILRVPGTLNHKYDPPRPVTIERLDPRSFYKVEDIERAFPPEPKPESRPTSFTVPPAIPEGRRNDLLYRLARSLKTRNLSHAAILAALRTENEEKGRPPLDDAELVRIADHAITQPDRPDFQLPVPTGRPDSEDSEHSEDGGVPSWQPPVPFHEFDLPPFPTDAFPTWLRDYVEAKATETQTPLDLPAGLVLSVVAAVCAKVVEIEVRPGFVEAVNIYIVVSLEPGNRKSAVFQATVAPLEDFEQAEHRRQVGEIKAAQLRKDLAESRLEDAEVALKNAKPAARPSLEVAVQRCAQEVAEIQIPTPCRMLADDVTPEKLTTLLAEQGGRIAVMSAEGDIFDMMAGRYGTGGMSNFGVFLKGHAGDTIRVDRVGRASEFVTRPAVTLGLTVQPEVLRGLSRHPGFRGRGLLARFFYALPESLMGRRKINARPVPRSVRVAYEQQIRALLALPVEKDGKGNLEPRTLRFTEAAQETLEDFERWLEPQLQALGQLGSMTDWAGKLVGGIARIAGLLHMAEHAEVREPWKDPIRSATIERAISIGRYFLAHARAAYDQMGMDPEVEAARYILSWLTARATETFTVRELFQATKGRFKKVAGLRPVLALLVEHGFIREQVLPPRPGPGRKPSQTFEVNPLIASQKSQNPQNYPAGH
jgi:replicative DNA helicase